MLAIIQISCSLASPELVKIGGAKPLIVNKAWAKLGIGIIWANVGGQVLGETSGTSAHSATEAAKGVTFTHTLCILMMLQLMVLQLVK